MSDTYRVQDHTQTFQDLVDSEASDALRNGEHYWLATTLHKVKGPSLGTEQDPLILDAENYRGTQVACALCGEPTDEMPCPGI